MSVRESVIFLIRVIFWLITFMCSSRVKLNNNGDNQPSQYKGVRYLPRIECEQSWALTFLPVQVWLDGDWRLEGKVERMLHVLCDHLQQVL